MDGGSADLKNLIGDKVLKHDGKNITEQTFEEWYAKFSKDGQYVCFYFGAHWAPPCRIFTKSL